MFATKAVRASASVLGRAGRRAFSTASAEAPLAKRLAVGSFAAVTGASLAYSLSPPAAESKAARKPSLPTRVARVARTARMLADTPVPLAQATTP